MICRGRYNERGEGREIHKQREGGIEVKMEVESVFLKLETLLVSDGFEMGKKRG